MYRILCFSISLALLGEVQSTLAQQVERKKNVGSEAQTNTLPKSSSGAWQKLVMQPFHDNKGQLMVEFPLPATWKIASSPKRGEPTIVGPNNVKVIDFPSQNFIHTRDPGLHRTYTQTGQRLRLAPSIPDLIQQDFVPWAAGQGLTFVKYYELPEIIKIDKWYNDQLYKAVPMETDVGAVGIEWKHNDTGHQFFMILHRITSQSAQMQTWHYYSSGLQADKEHFDTARKQLIFALANARYNLGQIANFNQAEAEKAGKSWAAHNQRLAQNQAAFEASQRVFVNRSTAAHDALMSGWKERNAASDVAHERFVDTITERQNVVNPTTGARFKVESGQNQYWMNPDGKYISANDPTYDPNLDKALNHHKWDELKKVD
jgi:hypothetical protein